MTQMSPEQTADTKGEEDGEFFVEKVIKMRVNKVGMEEFLVQWAGYPLSEATWEPFEHLSGEEAREYSVISVIIPFNLFTSAHPYPLYRSRGLGIEKREKRDSLISGKLFDTPSCGIVYSNIN